MSISTEIARIQTARNTLRTKAVELGIATGVDKLDVLAAAFEEIENRGSVSATVQEGDTYTIPKGYHNGSGTVSGVAGGGNYTLQSKQVTPTKKQQNVTPDSGYYGLSDVTVAAIPENFQDVTSVTAAAGDVLATKVFVASDGSVVTGEMPNIGAVAKVLDATTKAYTVPKGYHTGTGTVSIVTEEKSATPTKEEQVVTATTGKVINKFTVAAIPKAYQDVTGVTASADHVLTGDVFVDATGAETNGTMPNIGSASATLDTTTTSFAIAKGYHDGTGAVNIELEEQSATPRENVSIEVRPRPGKLLSKVTVDAIPFKYVDTSDATATAANILDGMTAYVKREKLEGTMPNNGAIEGTIDGMSATSFSVPAGYTTGGTVTLDNSIEAALAAI